MNKQMPSFTDYADDRWHRGDRSFGQYSGRGNLWRWRNPSSFRDRTSSMWSELSDYSLQPVSYSVSSCSSSFDGPWSRSVAPISSTPISYYEYFPVAYTRPSRTSTQRSFYRVSPLGNSTRRRGLRTGAVPRRLVYDDTFNRPSYGQSKFKKHLVLL